jgi:hypothetical protein
VKTLSTTLLNEQKKATAQPAISLEVRTYGHPAKAALVQAALFAWTQFYAGSETVAMHASAIAADGSLVRAWRDSGALKYQRVANPGAGSDYTAWTTMTGSPTISGPVAMCANANYVIILCNVLNGAAYYLTYYVSTDNGATFAFGYSWAVDLRGGVACCYKPNGELGIIAIPMDSSGQTLRFYRYSGGGWLTYTASVTAIIPSSLRMSQFAMYYDGDWNIVAGTYVLATASDWKSYRFIVGDGYMAAAGAFSAGKLIPTATADRWLLTQQFQESPEVQRKASSLVSRDSNLSAPLIVENIDAYYPYVCKPSGHPPVLSFVKLVDRYFMRLRPGSIFYDADWYTYFKMTGVSSFGVAVCCDSNYIWATRANEVWRSRLPGALWDIPTAGAGAGGTAQTIPLADIRKVDENIKPLATSTLDVTLDNSRGTYSSLPGTYIKKGSQVSLACGYLTPAIDVPAGNIYFIDSWTYDRSPGTATVTLHCIDAWGLLEQYTIPGDQEYNLMSNTHSIYDLISKLVQCIGGTLSYVSRSTDITALYQKMEISAGDSGAGILRRLLELVPDTIYFTGLSAYIINPQAADAPVYQYNFPEVRI